MSVSSLNKEAVVNFFLRFIRRSASTERFSVRKTVKALKGPFIEVGGPTEGGFELINPGKLSRKVFVSNLFPGCPYYDRRSGFESGAVQWHALRYTLRLGSFQILDHYLSKSRRKRTEKHDKIKQRPIILVAVLLGDKDLFFLLLTERQICDRLSTISKKIS